MTTLTPNTSPKSTKTSSKLTCEWGDETHKFFLVKRASIKQSELMQRGVPGARWQRKLDAWKLPGDLQTLALLRRKFGRDIVFSRELIDWVKNLRAEETQLQELQKLPDTDLRTFRHLNPEIFEKMRPDQRVGTRVLAEAPCHLIADDPGLGKTWQVIASIMENGAHLGPNLVICPKISIRNIWLKELNLLQDELVFVAPDGRKPREAMFEELQDCFEMDVPFWLVVNWSMITLRNGKFQFPQLETIKWNNVIVDEAHLTGMANPSSQTAQGLSKLRSAKRIAMTGTPMGGKPLRLWGILHWLDPNQFSNQYQWAERWVEKSKGYGSGGQTFTQWRGVSKDKQERFAKAHSKYILRRRKTEVFKEMPEPHVIDLWVDMLPEQVKQYKEMEEKARVTIEDQEEILGRVNVTTMLATYAWLKQFANGYCDLKEKGYVTDPVTGIDVMKYRAAPTDIASPKLDAIWQVIQELDIHENSGEKLLIFSQFKGWIDLVNSWLIEKGIATDKITGDVKTEDRNRIQDDFQNPEGRLKVVCLTTQAAGVSINLDLADNVIFMDETWNPDDQEQAWNRAHRASRIHLVTVRYLRTRKTIEEDVRKTNAVKSDINDILLDRYRKTQGDTDASL